MRLEQIHFPRPVIDLAEVYDWLDWAVNWNCMHIADRSADVAKRAQHGMEVEDHGDSRHHLEACWTVGLVAWYMWVVTMAVVAVVHMPFPLGER